MIDVGGFRKDNLKNRGRFGRFKKFEDEKLRCPPDTRLGSNGRGSSYCISWMNRSEKGLLLAKRSRSLANEESKRLICTPNTLPDTFHICRAHYEHY